MRYLGPPLRHSALWNNKNRQHIRPDHHRMAPIQPLLWYL